LAVAACFAILGRDGAVEKSDEDTEVGEKGHVEARRGERTGSSSMALKDGELQKEHWKTPDWLAHLRKRGIYPAVRL
jgi:hypothetical protein